MAISLNLFFKSRDNLGVAVRLTSEFAFTVVPPNTLVATNTDAAPALSFLMLNFCLLFLKNICQFLSTRYGHTFLFYHTIITSWHFYFNDRNFFMQYIVIFI